jgi:integrase
MTTLTVRPYPILDEDVARAVLAATRGDALLHAGTSLMLLAGLRPSEVRHVLVPDWAPGADPQLTIREGIAARSIRIAPSAASALGGYLAGEDAEPDEPLLTGLEVQGRLERAFRTAMRRAGLTAGIHDLRRTAVAAVREDGTPPAHTRAYFGFRETWDQPDEVAPREGYDRGIAAMLESSFAS